MFVKTEIRGNMTLAKIQLREISELIDPYAIKNFIISDKSVNIPSTTADYPFVTDCIIFAICISGNGHVKINFKEYEIKKDTIITIMPTFVVEFTSRSEDMMLEFLIFSPEFITEIPSSSKLDLFKSLMQQPCLPVSEEEAQKYLELHSFIVKQYKRKDHPFREHMAKSLLYSLLIEVGAIYYTRMKESESDQSVKGSSHQEELVYRFFNLLLTHHKEEKSFQFYADKMCLTPKYLSSIIKERTGSTAFAWINETLISSSRYLLKTTNRTILQISEELNFPNASFFGRFFKKHTGLTPVQYRES